MKSYSRSQLKTYKVGETGSSKSRQFEKLSNENPSQNHQSQDNRKTNKMEIQQSMANIKKCHTRIISDFTNHSTITTKRDLSNFARTNSKGKLRTEINVNNAETMEGTTKVKKDMYNDNVLHLLKDKLVNNRKNLKNNEYEVNKISNVNKIKEDSRSTNVTNLSKTQQLSYFQTIFNQMEIRIDDIYLEAKRQKSNKQQKIRELRLLIQYIKSQSSSRENRLTRKVQELQQRNIRLMSLVNHLKKQGIDVDSFWSTCDKF